MEQKNNENENLSRIKDILIGEEIQDRIKQFETFKEESNKSFNELKLFIEDKLNAIEEKLNAKGTEIDDIEEKQIEVEKKINNDIKNTISLVNTELLKEISIVENTINNKQEHFQEKIKDLENQLIKLLKQNNDDTASKYQELNDTKLNKETFADILSELSDKLKINSK